MSSRKKNAAKATKGNSVPAPGQSGEDTITKTISMPRELELMVQEKRIASDPEMDWSKHVRRVLRKDLEAAEAEKPQTAKAA